MSSTDIKNIWDPEAQRKSPFASMLPAAHNLVAPLRAEEGDATQMESTPATQGPIVQTGRDPSKGSLDPKEVFHHTALPVDAFDLEGSLPVALDYANLKVDVKIPIEGSQSKLLKILKVAMGLLGFGQPTKYTTRTILNDVSGHIEAGKLTALMGASGAGKSTLLNVLTRRIKQTEGTVTYNGVDLSPQDAASISAYVQQLDLFIHDITVHEHLKTQLNLRLGSRKARKECLEDQLLSINQLTEQKYTLIGNPDAVGGISGGQRKRLSVASELCTSPLILFADEPTTGLDSFMADSVVQVFKQLALQGRTVIATLHQPSSRIFDRFDNVILLADGKCIYAGERLGCIPWLEKLGHPCPLYMNPADHIIKSVHIPDNPSDRVAKLALINEYAEKWKSEGPQFLHDWETQGKSNFIKKLQTSQSFVESSSFMSEIAEPLSTPGQNPKSELVFPSEPDDKGLVSIDAGMSARDQLDMAVASRRAKKPSWCAQVRCLSHRSLMASLQNPMVWAARLMQSIILGGVLGLIMFRLDNSWNGNLARVSAMYSMLMNQAMASTFSVITIFMEEKPVFRREFEAGYTSASAYITARMIADLPVNIVSPIIYGTLVFWLTRVSGSFVDYLFALFIVILVANSGIALGYFASALTEDPESASVVANVTVFPLTIFGGLLVNVDTVVPLLSWIQYISFVRWGYHSLVIQIYRGVTVETLEGQTITGLDFIQRRLGFKENWFVLATVMLCVVFVFYRIVASVTFALATRARKENQ